MKIKRALISISNKEGIVDFAKELVNLGVEIISTGGTAKALKEANVSVKNVSEITNFPEMLEGRLKTLHPFVHGGILADRRKNEHLKQLKEQGIEPIDLVVVNLYPFKETIAKKDVSLEEAIENIDIGGPTMIRSAAKNFESVTVIVNPSRYQEVLEQIKQKGETTRVFRLTLATEAFDHTSSYDTAIYNYLEKQKDFPPSLKLEFKKIQDLRYGENPHQGAAYYHDLDAPAHSLATAKQLHGKELSFNNILDLDAAWSLVKEFSVPAVSIIKHTNPAGMAIANTILEAYTEAYATDPVSAFGSVVGVNKTVDAALAKKITQTYVEAVIAPAFLEEALEILTKKENIRLMHIGEEKETEVLMIDIRRVDGGILYQNMDRVTDLREKMKVITKKEPDDDQWGDLLFSWRLVKHVTSNAIVLARHNRTVGIGAGQMSRVDSVNLAIQKSNKKEIIGSACASDAFFPFRDGIDVLAKAGVKSIIQPGGSVRDEEIINACDQAGIAMVFTGRRHFRH